MLAGQLSADTPCTETFYRYNFPATCSGSVVVTSIFSKAYVCWSSTRGWEMTLDLQKCPFHTFLPSTPTREIFVFKRIRSIEN